MAYAFVLKNGVMIWYGDNIHVAIMGFEQQKSSTWWAEERWTDLTMILIEKA